MRDDIDARDSLERKYPGTILTIKYEDFILETTRTIDRVFKYIGQARPVNVDAWVRRTMKGRADNGPFGTTRVNASASVARWKTNVSKADIAAMNEHCSYVLNALQYDV